MEISEEQRKQAIVNARRGKQGKIKSKENISRNAVKPLFIWFILYLIYSLFAIFDFSFRLVHLFSHWLLWFCPTPPPKPSPTSPASHHHSNPRASAAGLFTGRAPKKKALPPVVQHHPQRLFQEMRLLLPHLSFVPVLCAWSEHAHVQTVLKTQRTLYIFLVFSCLWMYMYIKLCFCASRVFICVCFCCRLIKSSAFTAHGAWQKC